MDDYKQIRSYSVFFFVHRINFTLFFDCLLQRPVSIDQYLEGMVKMGMALNFLLVHAKHAPPYSIMVVTRS